MVLNYLFSDEMEIVKSKTSIIWRILSWVVTLLVPVALTLLAMRVHFSPNFLASGI